MVKNLIRKIIEDIVNNSKTKTGYRKPLIGYADASDEEFKKLKELISPEYKLPSDILPGAQTVVAFFLPFAQEVIEANRKHPRCAPEWAIAYQETNDLIKKICLALKEGLKKEGINTGFEDPTHNFDPERLISYWSHRSTARICGLGTFGLNQMLITEQGCAGRCGSVVIDLKLTPTPKFDKIPCLYYKNGTCKACIKLCPSKALQVEGIEKNLCYQHLLENDRLFREKYTGVFDACGKCQMGPCATKIPD